MGSIQRNLADLGTEVDYVTAGYTSCLQTLDVGVNKPFKHYLAESHNQFLLHNNNRVPKRWEVSQWITSAWKEVTRETIVNTWRKIGIVA